MPSPRPLTYVLTALLVGLCATVGWAKLPVLFPPEPPDFGQCAVPDAWQPATATAGPGAVEGPALVAQLGHSGGLATSADRSGRLLVTGGMDDRVVLWDLETGAELQSFEEGADGVALVEGAGALASISVEGLFRHDIATGRSTRLVAGEGRLDVGFTADGRRAYLVTDRAFQAWDLADGRRLWSRPLDGPASLSLAEEAGRAYLTTRTTVSVRDTETGEVLWLEPLPSQRTREAVLAVAPDGGRIALWLPGWGVLVLDGETGAHLAAFGTGLTRVTAVDFSSDGALLAVHGSGPFVHGATDVWSTVGEPARVFRDEEPWNWLQGEAFTRFASRRPGQSLWDFLSPEGAAWLTRWSADSRLVSQDGFPEHGMTSSLDDGGFLVGTAGADFHLVHETRDSIVWMPLRPRAGPMWTSEFLDERRLATASTASLFDRSAEAWHHEWDLELGRPVAREEAEVTRHWMRRLVGALPLTSPSGRYTYLYGELEDADGRLHPTEPWDSRAAAAFAADETVIAEATRYGSLRLRALPGGAVLWSVQIPDVGSVDGVATVAISADRCLVATGSADRTVRVFEAATGRELRVYRGHRGPIMHLSFDPAGRWLASGSMDGTTRLWDVVRGASLATLITFRDGSWAVVDEENRFDASNGGDIDGLQWVVDLEPIALAQLKDRFYEPGLLSKVLGLDDEPVRDVSRLRDVDLHPDVEVLERPSADRPSVRVRLTNRGGGIGRVVVHVNGREITRDARPAGIDPEVPQLELVVDLAGSPYLLAGRENRVEVTAFNAGGYLASRGLEVQATLGESDDGYEPRFWAVAAGVSDYAGDALDLRFAAKDARDMGAVLRRAGISLFGADRTDVTVLTTDEGAVPPTRDNLVAALQRVARESDPRDVVVVYMAGHGVTHGGPEGDYYYLSAEAFSPSLDDPAVRGASTLSSAELTDLLGRIPALKQVLILDTCGAGRAVESLTESRNVPASHVRAIQRMKDRVGLFVLAGSAADAVSYEANRYSQGLLTYSLLMGLRGAALRDGEFADVATLFNFAVDQVPRLAEDIGGIQQPELAAPRGGQSFDIGRLPPDVRAEVPLTIPRPLVVRSGFQDEERFQDHLNLTRRVDDRLIEEASARGGAVVFIDAAEVPGAHSLVGRYRIERGEVVVRSILFRNEAPVADFTVRGGVGDLEALAGHVVDETARWLEAHP